MVRSCFLLIFLILLVLEICGGQGHDLKRQGSRALQWHGDATHHLILQAFLSVGLFARLPFLPLCPLLLNVQGKPSMSGP